MNGLPIEDQPSGEGIIPADDEEAGADFGDLSDPGNPMSSAVAFYNAVTADEGPDLDVLRVACTPESWEAWGDFAEVRELIGEKGLATRADPPGTGEDDVRYAKVVALADPEQSVQSSGYNLISGQIITLQFRPDVGYWRVHGFGDYLRPEDLPPTS